MSDPTFAQALQEFFESLRMSQKSCSQFTLDEFYAAAAFSAQPDPPEVSAAKPPEAP